MFGIDELDMNDFDSSINGQDDFPTLETEDMFSPSFKGYSPIDELYDPHIAKIEDNFSMHVEDYIHARSQYECDQAKFDIQRDISEHKFWEKAKFDAEIEHMKDQAFLDHIRIVDEIIEKYRK